MISIHVRLLFFAVSLELRAKEKQYELKYLYINRKHKKYMIQFTPLDLNLS